MQQKPTAADPRNVEIQDYEAKFAHAFRSLNEAWIRQYFKIEPHDIEQLSDPEKSILNQGGCILVAMTDNEAAGVVALLPHGKDGFEMVKMAVYETKRGLGIGEHLATAAIEKARNMGAERVYLESNRKLTAAIALYQKLGFRELPPRPSPYSRVDIWMELTFEQRLRPAR